MRKPFIIQGWSAIQQRHRPSIPRFQNVSFCLKKWITWANKVIDNVFHEMLLLKLNIWSSKAPLNLELMPN